MFWSFAGTAFVLAMIWPIHFFGDRETKDFVEKNLVALIDFVRESRFANPELVFVLDQVADKIPYVYGLSVDVGQVSEEGFVLGGVPVFERAHFIKNDAYLISYDEDKKNPAWCAYALTYPEKFETVARPGKFLEDSRTRSRISHDDYTGTGFDRGHMAPNQAIGACYGEKAQLSTFLMSNIVPQYHEMNAGLWKNLEQRVLHRYTRRYGRVYVICGPVYGDKIERFKNGSGVAVPEACFLILADLDGDKMRTLSFIVPNSKNLDKDPARYIATIDEIEAATGIDFFAKFSDQIQSEIESYRAKTIW
ncbi:MAG: DNA/RNA non-specific endonuclease [Opitutales bacterium]|nr:DNA/RNA non-specific endonuclease [Opitutales bacterium]